MRLHPGSEAIAMVMFLQRTTMLPVKTADLKNRQPHIFKKQSETDTT